MSIQATVDGDLIEFFKEGKFWGIAHGCNCFCTMGSGIAKQIRAEFPEAFQADQMTQEGDRSKLGSFTSVATDHGILFNLYTQYTYWDESDMLSYPAVESCFSKVNEEAKLRGIPGTGQVFGIPMIGAGLARGDWTKISEIIDRVTPDVDIVLVNFNPTKKGGIADGGAQPLYRVPRFMKGVSAHI